MSPRSLLFIALLALSGSALATDFLTWDQGIEAMRKGAYPSYCVYIGREKSELIQRLKAEHTDTAGVPIIQLTAKDEALNPYTNTKVSGSRLIMNLTGPVNDLTGGSLLFFDKDGVMMPHFTLIQTFHKNRTAVVELYCKCVASPLRDKLTLLEFARLEGLPIGTALALEVSANKHGELANLYRMIPQDEVYFKGVDDQGQVMDPRQDAIITVVTRDPAGEVFIAEMVELWEKLSIPNGKEFHRPPLAVLGPTGARYPALDALGIGHKVGYLTDQQLAQLHTPMIVLPGNKDRGATEMHGFIPGQVVGQYILPKETAGLLNNLTILHPDIPVGDVDYIPDVAPEGASK